MLARMFYYYDNSTTRLIVILNLTAAVVMALGHTQQFFILLGSAFAPGLVRETFIKFDSTVEHQT
jgi:hypothetical protein